MILYLNRKRGIFLSVSIHPYEKAQKFFLKIVFLFNQVHLQCKVPLSSKESIKLFTHKELFESSEQIGTIQYGGIKYPHDENNPVPIKYVELRLEGTFLKSLNIYDDMNQLLVDSDANGWLKGKFFIKTEELKRIRMITRLISNGMEKKFGLDYLSFGIDKSVLELPRIKNTTMKKYDQEIAVQRVSDLLLSEGYKVSRTSNHDFPYHISVPLGEKEVVRIRVKHLQIDNAYKDSSLPYQVYKIDAFETFEEQKQKIKDVDFVVGYNFKDLSFACLNKEQFEDKKSRVVHEREGQNANYFNSWTAIKEFNK